MPIISKVGQAHWSIRAVQGAIVAILTLGAASMVYPLLLMLAGSVRGDGDKNAMEIVPSFLHDADALYRRYVEAKYNAWLENARTSHHREYARWSDVSPPESIDAEQVRLFDEFRRQPDIPAQWMFLGHSRSLSLDMWAANTRRLNAATRGKFNNDIAEARRQLNLNLGSFRYLQPPWEKLDDRRYSQPTGLYGRLWDDFRKSRPIEDFFFCDLDGFFRERVLIPKYGRDIADYNRAHGANYASYRDIFLSQRAPPGGAAREDWIAYVRQTLNGHFIRLDAVAADDYRAFLRQQHQGEIQRLNQQYGSAFAGFDMIPIASEMPRGPEGMIIDWQNFIRQRANPEHIYIVGPRQAWEAFLARRTNVSPESIAPVPLPTEMMDYVDMQNHAGSLRWEFLTRHYRYVLTYVMFNGRGIYNTVVYCALLIGAQLLFNPLAAYALSRFKLPSTYTILLVCLMTMAFPPEVTMIPVFLLLRSFPLWPMVGAALASMGMILATAWILRRWRPRADREKRAAAALLIGVFGGIAGWVWLWRFFGVAQSDISLLNSFSALILPELANGFSIFLLKGFFDSLPRELYEAADIDGAGEWTKFWTITMNLSKPILAVLALGAFTSAYSNFMFALILIPDPKMWTLMVWLYELQRYSHPSVVFASLVLAAVPTFLVFVLCQNVIMRGIVVPVEK